MAPVAQSRILLVPESGLYLGFRLLPILRRAGYEVDVLILPDESISHSRYVGNVFVQPDDDHRLRWLLEHFRPGCRWRTVIIPHEFLARRLMREASRELLEFWQPGFALGPAREFYLTKLALAELPPVPGLRVPEGAVCRTASDVRRFGEAVGWPVIVKPPERSGGGGVFLVNSPAELASGLPEADFPALAQRFVSGPKGTVDMICSQGRVLAWLASETSVKEGGAFGFSTGRDFRAMPELWPLTEAVARHSQIEGFAGFDWVREQATGEFHLIEFHPRAPSGFRFGRACGVDFAAAVTAWLDGAAADFQTLSQPTGPTVRSRYFPQDLMRCIRQRDLPGLCGWLPGNGVRHDVFWDDPKPLWGRAISRLRKKLSGR